MYWPSAADSIDPPMVQAPSSTDFTRTIQHKSTADLVFFGRGSKSQPSHKAHRTWLSPPNVALTGGCAPNHSSVTTHNHSNNPSCYFTICIAPRGSHNRRISNRSSTTLKERQNAAFLAIGGIQFASYVHQIVLCESPAAFPIPF